MRSSEYPKGSGIRLLQKANASGTQAYGVSWQVTIPAKITGRARKRQQFRDEQAALRCAEEAWRGHQKQGEAYFEASIVERNEFVNELPKLRKAGVSLSEVVAFALPRLRPAGGDRTLAEVINEMRQSKQIQAERGSLRPHSERSFGARSQKVVDGLGDILARDLTLDNVRPWIESYDSAPRTLQNMVGTLAEVLNFAVARRYAVENILEELTAQDRRELFGKDETEAEPEILSLEESQKLLVAALQNPQLNLLGAVVLGLFCGIRTEEVIRLDWKDVRTKENFVKVGRQIAKKRRIRNVTLPDNAIAWLSLCPTNTGSLIGTGDKTFYDRFHRLHKLAGFSKWPKNAMRHSYGSYHFALHGDSIMTSNEMGHRQGDAVLFDHYRALATKAAARKFFNILPPASLAKVVKFAS